MTLENKIEALLYFKNEPLEWSKIARLTGAKESEVREAVRKLSNLLEGHGLCIVETDDEVSLATAREMKDFLAEIAKDEIRSEIGKAGLETLAIILYNGPLSRREIDYLR